MNYKRKEKGIIKAEQFLCEPNHPSSPANTPNSLPEGVARQKFTDYQDPAPYYKWVLDGSQEIHHKDWVVTLATGKKKIYPNKEFKKKFEATSEEV